ncbi:87kDa Transposase [Cinara cedri]|uniref:87kDa Transposase n=1 Tax=Cinara cedri TaxID=506608 RepID=A0A5E4M0M8_9HEMI|nr:87kDa Transposase [Cinara cedri]
MTIVHISMEKELFLGNKTFGTPWNMALKLKLKKTSTTIRTVKHEALEYIVGYVARRFEHKYPNLGKESSVSLDSSLSTSWTQHMSRGHLITPSDTLMRVAKVMNKYFEAMHGTSFNKNPKVMETLETQVIFKSNDVLPDEVVSCLIRTRTLVRFNHLNTNIVDNAPTVGNKTKIRTYILCI